MNLIWYVLVAACAVTSLLLLVRTVVGVRHGYVSPYFAIFFCSALIYLELAPAWVTITGSASSGLLGEPVPIGTYAFTQVMVLATFIFPVLISYRSRTGPLHLQSTGKGAPSSDRKYRLSPIRQSQFALVAFVAALAYAYFVARYGLLFRRQGTEANAEAIIGLPGYVYVVVRTLDLCSFFLAAILVLHRAWATSVKQKRLTSYALISLTASYLFANVFTSRLGPILFILNLAAWSLVATGFQDRYRRWAKWALLCVVLGFVLMEVALNAREIIPATTSGSAAPEVRIYSIVNSGEGVRRLDCIDLTARLEEHISLSEPPALGAAWKQASWTFRRFVDPAGFDRFRRSGLTTAKSDLIARYLNLQVPDYYSCLLTDLHGNWWWPGVAIAAILIGLLYRWIDRQVRDPRSGRQLVLAVFAACWLLPFESEFIHLLIGWLQVLPVLVGAIIWCPFGSRVTDLSEATKVGPSLTQYSRR